MDIQNEPTASLDPEIGDFVRTFLENYKKEKKVSILLASLRQFTLNCSIAFAWDALNCSLLNSCCSLNLETSVCNCALNILACCILPALRASAAFSCRENGENGRMFS